MTLINSVIALVQRHAELWLQDLQEGITGFLHVQTRYVVFAVFNNCISNFNGSIC